MTNSEDKPKRSKGRPFKKGQKPGPGRPPFVPTASQRRIVERCMAYSFTHEETRAFIFSPRTGAPIDLTTLKKYFKVELAAGKSKTVFVIAQNMARTAMSKTHKDATKAGVFYLTNQGGWSSMDRDTLERERETAEQRVAGIIDVLGDMDRTVGGSKRAASVASNGNGHVNGNGKAGKNGHEGNGHG